MQVCTLICVSDYFPELHACKGCLIIVIEQVVGVSSPDANACTCVWYMCFARAVAAKGDVKGKEAAQGDIPVKEVQCTCMCVCVCVCVHGLVVCVHMDWRNISRNKLSVSVK